MKKFLSLMMCFLFITSFTACSNEEKKELNIMTWAEYIPEDVIRDYENETGIKINYSNYNTNEEMLAKLQATKGSQFDIVICSDYMVEIMNKEGLLKELDKSKIPNFENIEDNFKNKYYDMENKYSAPYSASSAIIVYNPDLVSYEIKGYKDLWNEDLKDSIVLLDGDRDIIGLTMQKLGYSVNEIDEKKINEAGEELLNLKPNVIGFDANKPHEMIISKQASVGYMFGSQATAAKEVISNLEFVYPEEGMGFYIDNVVIPVNSPNSETAYDFLNYLLEGEVSAKISSQINYINTNKAAKEFLPEEFLNNLTVNIPEDVLAKAEVYKDLGDARVNYDKIWTEFKSN